jgi:metal-sulfur cluster biosynthetic enzyme
MGRQHAVLPLEAEVLGVEMERAVLVNVRDPELPVKVMLVDLGQVTQPEVVAEQVQ